MFDYFFSFTTQTIQQKSFLSIPLAFLSGILVSFTPCFFPIIPILLGIIGVTDPDVSPSKRRLLILCYIGGFATVFTLLGVIFSWLGVLFGSIARLAITKIIIGNLLLIFGFSLLGIIRIPFFGHGIKAPNGKGFRSAYWVGILTGLSTGGCLFPVLGGILSVVAISRDLVFGTILLASFSAGVGVLFFFAGVLGVEVISRLKKYAFGAIVNRILGFLLIGVAEVFFIDAGRVWL